MSDKFLCVDDDADIIDTYKVKLGARFAIDCAQSGIEGLQKVSANGPYAVVISDLNMPGMDGIEFLGKVRELAPDTVRIMVTGSAYQNAAEEAINKATIFRFLPKPCPVKTLAAAMEEGLHQYKLVTAERELLEKTLMGSISLLTDILALLDESAFGRNELSQQMVRALCAAMKIEHSWEIELAAVLTNIGKVAIPPIVSHKLSMGMALNDIEQDIVQHAPEVGSMLLSRIPRLENVAKIILFQNKDFDGGGFPGSTSGNAIPLGSRIIRLINDLQLDKAPTLAERTANLHKRFPNRYDPAIIEGAQAFFASSHESAGASLQVKHVRQVTFSELRPGQILRSGIIALDGTLLAAADQALSIPLLERLTNFARLGKIREPISVER